MRNLPVLLIALVLAGNAYAQGADEGPYAGGGLSIAFEKFDLPPGAGAEDAIALDLLAGYRMSSFLALEGEAQLLSDFDLDRTGGDVDGAALTGNAKLFPLPPTTVLQPFVLVGMGLLALDGPHRIDANKTNWMYQIGGGADFPVAERTLLEVKATYRFPQGSLDDFEYWTLGANVQYRF